MSSLRLMGSGLPALGRRRFCALAASSLVLPGIAWPKEVAGNVVLYTSIGPEFSLYKVNEGNLALTKDSSTMLPANIQYAWPHPSRKIFYVAYSNRAGSSPGTVHGVAVLHVDGRSGQLQPSGESLTLNNRPISITVSKNGANLLVAYNYPSELDVFRINPNGSLGAKVTQATAPDAGIYTHQVRVSPSDRTVVLVTRGNDATSSKREDPGALKVFDFKNGQLSNEKSIAPGNGFGFGPRHVDFHPTMPWMYVSMERENQLQVFGLQNGKLTAVPLFIKVYAGGENSIAVFRIDEQSGEPTLIQNIPTQNFHVRTFTLHPNGKMLVAASVAPMLVHEGDGVNKVSASLSVFRFEDNGMLTFVRKSDIDTTAGPMFWCGLIALDDAWSSNAA